MISHAQHMEILQSSLQHIGETIISIRIRRPEKKTRLQHKILCIADNPFNHLAIVEVNPYPKARNDRRMFMKMKGSVAKIPIKSLHEKDRLGVLGGNFLHCACIQQFQSNRIKRIDRIVPQKLFDGSQLARLRQPPDGMILVPDDNPITICI